MTSAYYTLCDANGANLGDFAAADLRAEVDRIAAGADWGWRSLPDGSAEAVCDHAVIATAHPHAN